MTVLHVIPSCSGAAQVTSHSPLQSQMDLLKTRRALVTGAQRGIGRAIAEAYAGQAAALILHAEPSFENDLNQVLLSPHDESSCSAAACSYEAGHLLV